MSQTAEQPGDGIEASSQREDAAALARVSWDRAQEVPAELRRAIERRMAVAAKTCGKMVGVDVACVRARATDPSDDWTIRLGCACADRNKKVVAGRAGASLRGTLAEAIDGFRGVMTERCMAATRDVARDPALGAREVGAREIEARGNGPLARFGAWRVSRAVWRRTLAAIGRRD